MRRRVVLRDTSGGTRMADTSLRLVKQFAEFQPTTEVKNVPRKRRGIYVLYKQRKKAGKRCYDVVYLGMTTAGMRGRLSEHLKKKEGLWTHFSAFEVWENVHYDEIRELEGLFRHIYRKDTRANKLNRQKRFARVQRVQQDTFAQWR